MCNWWLFMHQRLYFPGTSLPAGKKARLVSVPSNSVLKCVFAALMHWRQKPAWKKRGTTTKRRTRCRNGFNLLQNLIFKVEISVLNKLEFSYHMRMYYLTMAYMVFLLEICAQIESYHSYQRPLLTTDYYKRSNIVCSLLAIWAHCSYGDHRNQKIFQYGLSFQT